jgi:ketosteroid isomerase-like protein
MSRAFRNLTWLTTLLASSLLACARAPAADSDRAALDAAIHRWIAAVNAQDAATLATTMTDDVELSDGTTTVTGREASARALRELAARGRLNTTTREITIDHDVAWHVVALTQTRKNGDVHARGQAIEIWKRVRGEWQLHRRWVAGVGATDDLLTRPSTREPVLDRPQQ